MDRANPQSSDAAARSAPSVEGVAEQVELAVSVQSGTARAAVLGINDGLVTNIALILGVVGASADPSVVRLAGLASLVAGACSMAVGEYISMRAQVELLERLLTEEREAIARNPAREAAILREVLLRDGIDPKAAEAICRQASRDPERALGIYSRAVLGVNPVELGSPWASALSSLVTFAAGAFVPLAPWLIATGPRVAPMSFVLGLVAAATIGGVLGWQTRRHVLWSAMRQVFVVSLAAGLTFLVGWLLGAAAS